MRQGGTFFVVIISVGSNAVAAYTGNNHACLRFISSFKMIHVYMMSTNFSPLDEIIDKLGGPGCVSEMTGRRGRIVRRSQTDKPQYEQRSADVDAYGGLDSLNVQEVKNDIISYYLVEDAIYLCTYCYHIV